MFQLDYYSTLWCWAYKGPRITYDKFREKVEVGPLFISQLKGAQQWKKSITHKERSNINYVKNAKKKQGTNINQGTTKV